MTHAPKLFVVLLSLFISNINANENDPCCTRYGWYTKETIGNLTCEGRLPNDPEDVTWCIISNIEDMILLDSNNTNAQNKTYTFLTQDNFEECTSANGLCGMLYLACVSNEPHCDPDKMLESNSNVECNETYEDTKTYVQYTPQSKPNNPDIQTKSILNNQQSTLHLRFLFADTGANPFDIDIENGQNPLSPFLGQIIVTLTDDTRQLPGWVECDGREYNVMVCPELFGVIDYTFGCNWYDDTLMIPDCRNKILIHQSDEFVFGTIGGSNSIDLTKNGILLPSHDVNYDTTIINLQNNQFIQNTHKNEHITEEFLVNSSIDVTITENIVKYPNTVTKFNNMQEYLVLNFLIVTNGKNPYSTENKKRNKTNNMDEVISASINNDNADTSYLAHYNEMYIGEIVIFANPTVPPGFVSCDGSYLLINDYPDLFQVLQFQYGGNHEMGKFKIPDCGGKALMHDNNNIGEIGGEIITEITKESIPSHSHDAFNFISESNLMAHVQTHCENDIDDYHYEPISNWMPYIKFNFGYYNGTNYDECRSSHFLGTMGIFIFDMLPFDFDNRGLIHISDDEANKIKNLDLIGYVSQDFVWESNSIILPDFNGHLLSHSIQNDLFGTIIGYDHIGGNQLIPHQHVTFITTINTYCKQPNESPITIEDTCKIGEWTPWSSCIFSSSEDIEFSSNGYQYRTRKVFILDETNGTKNTNSYGNDNDCECTTPSREVKTCSNKNCLKIILNDDSRSYFDNKWKLYNLNNHEMIAYGRDNGYGNEGCIIVTPGDCYELHLYDKHGDGICCEYGEGSIQWYYEDELLGFYHNDDDWYEQIIDICIPNYINQLESDNCISVNITGDKFVDSHNFWNIYDQNGQTVMTSSKPYINEDKDCKCQNIQNGYCYTLVVFDENGDGICCQNGNGTIIVSKGGHNLLEYEPKIDDEFTYKSFDFCT